MAQFYSPCTGLGIYSSCETEDKILRSLACFWHLEEEYGRNHIHMVFEKRTALYHAVVSAGFISLTL